MGCHDECGNHGFHCMRPGCPGVKEEIEMSAFIGSTKGPNHNSPHDATEVWCSVGGVELHLFAGTTGSVREGLQRSFDPIAARNLAALLVRGSEEVERMRARRTEPEAG